MRKFYLVCIGLILSGLLAGITRAETFQLTDGQSVSGDIVSADESGMIVREGENRYSDRIPWTKFSQADLKKLAKNPKYEPLVEPFIEITQKERLQRTEVHIKTPPRLARPAEHSLIGAMFSSSVGLLVLLLLYAANLYAAYEISIYRARPVGLVCGVAAVAPLLVPALFLAMPTRLRSAEAEEELAPQEPAGASQTFAVPGAAAAAPPEAAAPAAAAGGLRLSHGQSARSTSALPETQVFQRGAFTFNRRFFETKFAGFFGMVRRDAEKDLVLVIKAARGQYVGQRVTRIAANDLHLSVQKGPATEEVMIPFSEIQEVQLKHKDA